MKGGGFPGREEAIQFRLASLQAGAQARASRRMFLGLAVGGALGACAGGAALKAAGSTKRPEIEPDLVGDGTATAGPDLRCLEPRVADTTSIQIGLISGM